MWGGHDFYLGKKLLGVVKFIAFFIVLGLTVQKQLGVLFAPLAILAFIEFILFLVMPQAEFDAKYNSGVPSEKVKKRAAKSEKKKSGENTQVRKSRGNHLIKDGFIAYA